MAWRYPLERKREVGVARRDWKREAVHGIGYSLAAALITLASVYAAQK